LFLGASGCEGVLGTDRIRVGGVSVGRAPLADEVFVEPGPRTIEARLAKHVAASKTLEAKKGGAERIELTLVPESGSADEPNRLPAYIAFGVGGAGLVLGIVAGGVTIAKTNALGGKCDASNVCTKSLRGDFDEANTFANVSNVGFIVAGIGAAVGTTLLVLSVRKAPAQASVVAGPGFVGVKGAF
jgi:hypothetical protein